MVLARKRFMLSESYSNCQCQILHLKSTLCIIQFLDCSVHSRQFHVQCSIPVFNIESIVFPDLLQKLSLKTENYLIT